jgi:hypothetical protein
MKRFIKVAAVGLSLLLVGTIVTAKGMRGLNKNNRGRANLAAIASKRQFNRTPHHQPDETISRAGIF